MDAAFSWACKDKLLTRGVEQVWIGGDMLKAGASGAFVSLSQLFWAFRLSFGSLGFNL